MADEKKRPAPAAMIEIGQTGLEAYGGFVYDEILPKLQGLNGAKIYREMADNDPILAAVLYAVEMLVRNVEWDITPADDSSAALEAKELVEGMLFDDLTHTWPEFLSEVCTMFAHGYSLFEIVWKVRAGEHPDRTKASKFTDNLLAPSRLAPRSQLTVWRWNLTPEGEVASVEQLLISGGVVDLPGEKVMLFRTTSRRNNPEGRSILRGAYVPYLRKKAIEEAEGRAALRSAGVVTLKIPSEYMDPAADDATRAAYLTYRAMATGLAQDRQGSVILPSDRDSEGNPLFELLYTIADSRRSAEMGAIVERFDKRMAMTCLADFILVGHSGAGSFALSSDKTDIFSVALGAFLGTIRHTVNRKLIDRIWRVNALDDAVKPTLTHGDIESTDLSILGSFLASLAQAGAPLFPDDELENRLRKLAGLPAKQAGESQARAVVGPLSQPDPEPGAAEKKPPKPRNAV